MGIAGSIILAILGIMFTGWIAFSQHKQLRQLHEIGNDTRDTARKLKSDAYKLEIVSTFFSLGAKQSTSYRCVFPVYFDRRPLPFIVSGDYHALHVLQSLIGTDVLMLTPEPCPDGTSSGHMPYKWSCNENVIFLCTPQANPALAELAKPVELVNNTAEKLPEFMDIVLPCWFANEPSGDAGQPNIKTIWIPELSRVLRSPAEEDYKRALELESRAIYEPKTPVQVDYALLLRLSVNGQKVVVVAGVHQYGTWIGGDFFERLVCGEDFKYREEMLSDKDFIAVIWGEFNSRTFKVERCDVHEEYVWIRSKNGWARVPHKDIGLHHRQARD